MFDGAVKRGWLGAGQLPQPLNTGSEGKARETFTIAEYKSLTAFMVRWCKKGHMEKTKQMRELLRDYVLILANTGMRHGTEALGLKWRDIAWTVKKGERYIQITVNGKTGKRELIAYHHTEDYLKRIAERDENLKDKSFDDILKEKLDLPVFRLASGAETKSLNGSFRHLMRDSGLDKNRDVKTDDFFVSGSYSESYKIAGDYDLVSRMVVNKVDLCWVGVQPVVFCKGGGISVVRFLEAFLEETMVRLGVWKKQYSEVASDISGYLSGPFRLLSNH